MPELRAVDTGKSGQEPGQHVIAFDDGLGNAPGLLCVFEIRRILHCGIISQALIIFFHLLNLTKYFLLDHMLMKQFFIQLWPVVSG
jgi:hypothetical protein